MSVRVRIYTNSYDPVPGLVRLFSVKEKTVPCYEGELMEIDKSHIMIRNGEWESQFSLNGYVIEFSNIDGIFTAPYDITRIRLRFRDLWKIFF